MSVPRGGANQGALGNRLLAAFTPHKLRRSLAASDLIELRFGEILFEPGKPIRDVYFPVDCLVSLLTTVDRGHAREVGLVGREGMVGIPIALGVQVSSVRALVQGAGRAWRMPTANFRTEHGRHGLFYRKVNQYIHELMVQIAQTAACNVSHRVEGRLARWLLMTRDRVGAERFRLTQELLSSMLGVQRVAVTHAAGRLQRRRLISYSRGEIEILSGERLEHAACQCYQLVKAPIAKVRKVATARRSGRKEPGQPPG